MSNISVEHKEKLQQLIYSDEFESVVQGLELLDTMTKDEDDIYDVFDFTDNVPASVDELDKRIFECEHWNYIKVWMLGKLTKYNVGWVVNLTSLDLSDRQLTQLPESIGDIINITKLNLSNNQLTTIPKSVENLTNLIELNLGNNYLKEKIDPLFDSISKIPKLTQLDLYQSRLTKLPESIGNLTLLTTLDLYFN